MKKIKPIEEWGIWKAIVHAEKFILVFASAAAALVVFAGVIMRYVLKTDLFGIEEIITIIVMWLYFIGGAYGSYEDSHIKADMLPALIKNPKALKALSIFIYAVSAVLLTVIAIWGLQYAQWSILTSGQTPGWRFPLIISQIPITIGFVLMWFYAIHHMIRAILKKSNNYEGSE